MHLAPAADARLSADHPLDITSTAHLLDRLRQRRTVRLCCAERRFLVERDDDCGRRPVQRHSGRRCRQRAQGKREAQACNSGELGSQHINHAGFQWLIARSACRQVSYVGRLIATDRFTSARELPDGPDVDANAQFATRIVRHAGGVLLALVAVHDMVAVDALLATMRDLCMATPYRA